VEIIFITIPVTLLFIGAGAALFFWASKKGQFDDLDSPAHRILFDDDNAPNRHAEDQISTDEAATNNTNTAESANSVPKK
jgi:cbb3-type cytochrome oxidase maturation protein